MIKSKNIIVIFLFFLLIPHKTLSDCFISSDSTFSNYEDELLIINKIPIGTIYEEVKNYFPNVSELRLEGRHYNLYDAKEGIDILNHKAIVEFNFQSYDTLNILYSYYYFIDSLDNSIADSLYLILKNFYSNHYGHSSENTSFDPAGITIITSFWNTKEFDIVLGKNIYKNYSAVSWGFQKP